MIRVLDWYGFCYKKVPFGDFGVLRFPPSNQLGLSPNSPFLWMAAAEIPSLTTQAQLLRSLRTESRAFEVLRFGDVCGRYHWGRKGTFLGGVFLSFSMCRLVGFCYVFCFPVWGSSVWFRAKVVFLLKRLKRDVGRSWEGGGDLSVNFPEYFVLNRMLRNGMWLFYKIFHQKRSMFLFF